MSRKAQATSTGSIAIASVGQTVSIGCELTAIQFISNATNACNLQVYDGTSASGILLATLSIPASTTAPQDVTFNIPVAANKGLFTAGSGTGSSFVLHYIPR